jgi:hypothetical protein
MFNGPKNLLKKEVIILNLLKNKNFKIWFFQAITIYTKIVPRSEAVSYPEMPPQSMEIYSLKYPPITLQIFFGAGVYVFFTNLNILIPNKLSAFLGW